MANELRVIVGVDIAAYRRGMGQVVAVARSTATTVRASIATSAAAVGTAFVGMARSVTHSIGLVLAHILSVRTALVGLIGVFVVQRFIRNFIEAGAALENFQLQIRATFGEFTLLADAALQKIIEFARVTPFSTREVIEGFTLLQAAGLETSERVMKAIGDTAFVFNRDFLSVATALISMETEVLRRLGIVLERTGEKASIMSRGIRLEVENTRDAIFQGLVTLMEKGFGGAMAKAIDTWRGAKANLKSLFEEFSLNTGKQLTGLLIPRIKEFIALFEDFQSRGIIDRMKDNLSVAMAFIVNKVFDAIEAVTRWAADNEKTIIGIFNTIVGRVKWAFAVIKAGVPFLGSAFRFVLDSLYAIASSITDIAKRIGGLIDKFEALGSAAKNAGIGAAVGAGLGAISPVPGGAIIGGVAGATLGSGFIGKFRDELADWKKEIEQRIEDIKARGGNAAYFEAIKGVLDLIPNAVLGQAKTTTKEIEDAIRRSAAQRGLRPSLLAAMIQKESGFNPLKPGSAGEIGIAQIKPGTAAQFKLGDVSDPLEGISGMAQIVAELAERYQRAGADFTEAQVLALAAYNKGTSLTLEQVRTMLETNQEAQKYVSDIIDLESKFISGQLTVERQAQGGARAAGGRGGPTLPPVPRFELPKFELFDFLEHGKDQLAPLKEQLRIQQIMRLFEKDSEEIAKAENDLYSRRTILLADGLKFQKEQAKTLQDTLNTLQLENAELQFGKETARDLTVEQKKQALLRSEEVKKLRDQAEALGFVDEFEKEILAKLLKKIEIQGEYEKLVASGRIVKALRGEIDATKQEVLLLGMGNAERIKAQTIQETINRLKREGVRLDSESAARALDEAKRLGEQRVEQQGLTAMDQLREQTQNQVQGLRDELSLIQATTSEQKALIMTQIELNRLRREGFEVDEEFEDYLLLLNREKVALEDLKQKYQELSEIVQGALKEAGASIQRSFSNLWQNIFTGGINSFKDFFREVANVALKTISDIMGALFASVLTGIIEGVSGQPIKDIGRQIGDWIAGGIKDSLKSGLSGDAKGGGISEFLANLFSGVRDTVSTFPPGQVPRFPGMEEFDAAATTAATTAQIEAVTLTATTAIEAASVASQTQAEMMAALTETQIQTVTVTGQAALEGTQAVAIASIKSVEMTAIVAIEAASGGGSGASPSPFQSGWQGQAVSVGGIGGVLPEFKDEFIIDPDEFARGIREGMAQGAQQGADEARSIFDSLGSNLLDIFSNVASGIGDFFSGAFESISSMASSLFSGLGSSLSSLLSGAGDFFSGIFSWIGGLFGFEKGGILSGRLMPLAFSGMMAMPMGAFQHGGIVDKPMIAAVGERAPMQKEAVVPLPDNRSIPVQWVGGGPERESVVHANFGITLKATVVDPTGFQTPPGKIIEVVHSNMKDGGQIRTDVREEFTRG